MHFPIAFLTVSYAIDIAYGLATFPQTASYARQVYDLAPHLGELARLSFYANTFGLAASIPAVLTGGFELVGMIKRQDLLNKLQQSKDRASTAKRVHPKIKVGLAHAMLNDAGLVAAGYNWWTRRAAVMNAPSDTNVIVSAVALLVLSIGCMLGATLVYTYGVGVRNASESRRLKEGKAE